MARRKRIGRHVARAEVAKRRPLGGAVALLVIELLVGAADAAVLQPPPKILAQGLGIRVPGGAADGDGELTAEEIFEALSKNNPDVTLEKVQEIVAKADADGNGVLDRDEVLASLALWTRLMKMAEPEEPASGFSQLCAVM